MEPSNEGNLLEVIDLAHTLRQEQLYIENEKSAFTDLSVTLAQNSTCVAELAWICSQQRQNLKHLIVSRPETGPAKCCKKANNLENTKFLDAYKAKDLKYLHVIAYTELFQYLHRSPYILAQSLSVGDRIPTISGDQMDCVIQTIATGLYGNAIHSKDVEMILKLLRELIDVQIVGNENRRRMLRAGSSAFSRLYYRLHESLFSAKIFLTAALHEPVMKVLIESDVILDVDFTKNEDGSNRLECANNIDHNSIINSHDRTEQLYNLSKEFIDNLTKNWSLFPSTLRWLVQTMCHLLKKAHIKDKDINEIITDMVFTHFICPAVVSPDIFGISDAPISEQARLNLIQIGRVLQMLALMKYEEVDSKYRELYNKFEVNVISNLLDQLLVSGCDISIGVIAIRSQQNDFERASVLVTQSELIVFTDFLRTVLGNSEFIISVEDRQKLAKILDQLPQKIYTSSMNGDSPQHIQSVAESSNRTKQSLLNLGKTTKNKIAKTMSLNIANVLDSEELLSVIGSQQNGACNVSPSHLSSLNNNAAVEETEQVLLFHISLGDESKLQLLTEAEVLKMNCIGQEIADPVVLSEENVEKLDKVDPEFDGIDPVLRPTHTKTTRFSLSHDDASIGNSDNLEAVSEAPSNHSVTSSLEMEENDQNDNLSDMVSANVSGRGTPNISGRDTPSSQVTEGDNPPNQIPTPQMAKIINKARSDIEDKFCKFEIKKLIEGDETISIISDTWSTDVLASDSETLDANERDRNFSTPLIPSSVVLPGDNNFDPLSASRAPGIGSFLDASETRSESAWSTDVFASDSEKLAEVDTDDNLSITAKSDITDAGRSDGDPTREPEIILQNNIQKAPDSPFFAPRVPNVNFKAPDSPMYGPRPADSTFFGGLNYDESSRDSVRSSSSISSLARSSVRTTNQYTGENSFQQNYKSSSDRSAFLNAGSSRMRRQNSAESSISNQSLNLEEFGGKTKQEKQIEFSRKFSKDLIDFGGFQEEGAAGIDKKIPVSANEDENFRGLYDGYSEESVIHRRLSSEQRNASFDGRRNGILELKSRESVVTTTNRHVSYENHEIIKKSSTILKTSEASITDDVKNQQNALDGMMLVQKTQELSLNSDNTTEQVLNKQAKSTGAIPKSISFDASADKSERNIHMRRTIDPLRLNGTGFFNKIKQGFKNRRNNKGRPGQDDYPNRSAFMSCNTMEAGDCDLSRSRTNDNGYSEMTEDILAKYRRKVSTSSEATNSDSTGGSCSANRKNSDIEPRVPNGILPDKAFAFLTAKKKLRAVLSTTDLHTADFCHTTCADASPLLTYLQIQLAQALNLQNLQQISYISEAIRCLNSLEQIQHQKLIEELQADILKRQSYLQYLMRYRQNLLSILANIARFEDLLRNDREMCNRHLIAVCVKMFLEKRQMHIESFQNEFIRLTVVDEKIDLLEEFMNNLITGLKADDILHGVADWQLQEAKTSIERILLQRLYKHVMFPNEDGDIARDEVLHEHIRKLKRVITPCHTALRIPQEYLIEAPWPFAQKQISYISAYKTPQEKLQCIVRCISSITCVLEMACDRSPAADDLLPVLIYVVIQANPPYLLSTIQYVNCFIGDKLHGSDQFSWTQFCSVVQFIKTMDYLD